ncbi:MAG TPA: lysophospholipid acyltransferase family protein [Vicinamibacteria bacterium]|nr:lysophospholipid acyltransferase family protein [Vicinamibacteria bacterium]
MTVYTIVCGAVSFALALVFRSGDPSHRVASIWARLILETCGVTVQVKGLENLRPGTTYLFASNHQSLFDTPIVFAHLPVSFRILYKKSLNRVPFLGWHLFMSGHIGVERENPKKARESLEHAASRIRGGTSVVVFPEGTRSFDGILRPFKKGSFRLALRAGIPVVPITIADSYLVMKRSEVTVHPRRIGLTIDRPIPLDNLDEEQAEVLAERVRAVVSRNLEATRA